MENLLREYLEKAFTERTLPHNDPNGPVVTISREFGCPSKLVAQKLTESLNKVPGSGIPYPWQYINKEIVETMATELDLKTVEVNYLLSSGKKGVLEDIMASFSPLYISDHRIRKTITKVVREIAFRGHVVIVGRGSVAVLHHRPNTLHIRLQAPLEWRIPEICKLRDVGESEAVKLAREMDKKRTMLIELLYGEAYDSYLFDISLNCQTLSQAEIVQTIMGSMRSRQMIP